MTFDWGKETLFVTGATSGLGRALAIEAGKRRATVLMLARTETGLRDTATAVEQAGGMAHYRQFDLRNLSHIPAVYASLCDEAGKPPTVLINNVGYQVVGFVQNTSLEEYEQNIRVNTLAPIALIQCVLPDMLRQERGVIGNVMSSIMYHSFPGVSSYTASKTALGAVHESLQLELEGKPVRTLLIRPGSFRSNYWKNTQLGNRIPGYSLPKGEGGRDPAFVAGKILDAVEENKEELDLSTFKDHVGFQLRYWAPRVLRKIIIRSNKKLLSLYPKA